MKKMKPLFAIHVVPHAAHRTRDLLPDQTLRLNFHNAPLQMVLDYIGDTLGLLIEVKPNVAVNDKVDAWSDQPLKSDEALNLLEQVLHRQGCTLIQNGHRLAIMKIEDAKKSYIPIRLARNHQGILKQTVGSRGLFTSSASIFSN